MIEILFPDTGIPTTGDCYGGTARLKGSPQYETAWNVYHQPVYAWLTEGMKPTWQALFYPSSSPADHSSLITHQVPSAKSRTFPQHGYVILRSIEGRDYWGSDSWAAFLNYYLDSVHSHRDKMNLILFGRGKVLAVDPEAKASVPHAFSSQVQRELNRTTVCHNTLMVDGKDHAGIGENLSLVDFKRTPKAKTATIADLKGLVYPGVKLQRTVIVTADYVLDVFQAASDEEHTYDWLFHSVDDEGKTRIHVRGGDGVIGRWGDASGEPWNSVPWNWLKNPRSVGIDSTWQADWHQGDLRFRLTMLGCPGTEVTACDFPKNDMFESPPIPMLIAGRKGKTATFIALYQAERIDLPSAAIFATGNEIKVILNGKTSRHTIKPLGT